MKDAPLPPGEAGLIQEPTMDRFYASMRPEIKNIREPSKSVMIGKATHAYLPPQNQLFMQDSKDATELQDEESVEHLRVEKLVKLELGPHGLRYRVLYRGVDGRAYVGWKSSTYFTQHCASALAAFAEFAAMHPTGFH